MAVSDQLLTILAEREENKRKLRKQILASDLKAFTIVVICVVVMCIAADVDSPLILFTFVLGTGVYIVLKLR